MAAKAESVFRTVADALEWRALHLLRGEGRSGLLEAAECAEEFLAFLVGAECLLFFGFCLAPVSISLPSTSWCWRVFVFAGIFATWLKRMERSSRLVAAKQKVSAYSGR